MTIHILPASTTKPEPNSSTRPAGPLPPASHGTPDQSERRHRLRVLGYFTLTILLGVVDAILIKTVWNVILRDSEVWSWAMAVITAIGASMLAWAAGRCTAIGSIDRHRSYLLWAALAGTTWALTGAAISFLRWHAGELTGVSINTEGATVTNAATMHHLMAVALVALYLMPGLMAGLHGYETGNPVAARQRLSHSRVETLNAQLRHDEARVLEQDLLLTQHHGHKHRINAEAILAKDCADALAGELKAYAHIRIAIHLGYPAAVPGPTQSATTADTSTGDTTADTSTGTGADGEAGSGADKQADAA